jgi:hypothetical protein
MNKTFADNSVLAEKSEIDFHWLQYKNYGGKHTDKNRDISMQVWYFGGYVSVLVSKDKNEIFHIPYQSSNINSKELKDALKAYDIPLD